MNKKIKITKDLCRKVQIMLAGGATMLEIGGLLGISKATVSRIKMAGFDPERYYELNRERMAKEKEKQEETAEEPEDECQGQISMDELEAIPPVEFKETPTPITDLIHQVIEKTAEEAMNKAPANGDQAKMMRFLAVQVDKLYMMMNRINDNLSQLLRAIRKE
jgi:hypothetical protein